MQGDAVLRPPSAGILLTDYRGRLVANVGNPFYALATLVLLTLLPYLVPLEYMELIKVAGPGEHVLFCAVLGGVLFGLYALYAALAEPRFDPRPERLGQGQMEAMHKAMTALMWTGLIANVAILAYTVPHFTGTIFSIKRSLQDLAGVNILSQTYLFAIGPFIYLSLALGRPYRKLLVWLAVVLTLRAFLMAERLAFLEFAVPVLVCLSLLRELFVPVGRLVLIALGVPTLFVVMEIFRSFYSKFVESSGWAHLDLGFILQWNLERLALYYADVTNKFYFTLYNEYFHFTEYWIQGVLRMGSRLGLAEYEGRNELLAVIGQFDAGNEEMTNPSGLATLLSDFGWWGLLVGLLIVAVLFVTHWRATRGHLISLAFYPVLFLTLVEMPRFVYLYNSRALFPLAAFFAAYLAVSLMARPSVAPVPRDLEQGA